MNNLPGPQFDSFYSVLKKRSKLGQKTNFWAHFERFFHYTLLRPLSYAPIFCQIKGLMMIHNRGKFHQYSISGSQAINFQMFLWRCSIHEMAPFGGFLGLFSPTYSSILLKISPEAVYCKTKIVCEQSFKIKCLSPNGVYPEFTILVCFWAQFIPRKQKILPKTKLFPETTFLGLSNCTSPKS